MRTPNRARRGAAATTKGLFRYAPQAFRSGIILQSHTQPTTIITSLENPSKSYLFSASSGYTFPATSLINDAVEAKFSALVSKLQSTQSPENRRALELEIDALIFEVHQLTAIEREQVGFIEIE